MGNPKIREAIGDVTGCVELWRSKRRRKESPEGVGAYVSGKPSDGSVEIVLKLLRNIVKKPENAKFRRIRIENPKIREAIGDVTGCVELLECVGFGLVDEDGEMWTVMEIPSEEGMLLIKKAISLLETQKVEELPSTALSKIDEPIEPKKVDRQGKCCQEENSSTYPLQQSR
ncbi:Plant UBX domain-containing protein 2 [Camellia lanceoleosa]|uniref:Plant UBX domain-containing protein 2 n=1 Tax=Camellia lanceoleosa TaxID=1840588 RepID=A0ACC0G434_9ERIC|nr:Plant UBX domain-containing protein 2 [Camellia lanceoleosa]